MLHSGAPTPPTEPGPPVEAASRESRREGVLDAAAREFNARGISRASFARIARDLGLTRAALYYYVKDRQDLVAQCYRRSCAVMAADLAAAEAGRGAGLNRLALFIRRALDPGRAPVAVLSELDYLTGEARAAIAGAHGDNVGRLRALIRSGVDDGSLRACDEEAVAQAMVGVIAWIPLSIGWLEGADSAYRARTVQALVDLVTDGMAADPYLAFVPPIGIQEFFPVAPRPFDRAAQAGAKIDQLLMTASRIINRRGVDGASLDDITGALGATKGAFYHYFNSKTELMTRCYRRGFDLFERFADAADSLGRDGLEKGLIGLHLNVQAHASGLSPLIQMVGVEALPPAVRREIRRRARALQRRFAAFAEQGLAEGAHRPMDLDALAQLAAGVFQWLPKWFDPADPRAGGALSEEYRRLFIAGLRRR